MVTQSPHNDDGFNHQASTPKNFFIVAIGASAGGLQSLESFFCHNSNRYRQRFVWYSNLCPTFRSLTPD